MAEFEVILTDNSDELLRQMEKLTVVALEAVGQTGERHAKEGARVGTTRSTGIKNYHGGSLRKSITHKVVAHDVYIGTNMAVMYNGQRHSYPTYLEYGTGIYAEGGKGRQSPWRWQDKNGDWHYTRGIKPTHWLRNAISDPKHIAEYKHVIQSVYSNVE